MSYKDKGGGIMAYKRQIAYFDYMEYGEKKGNGGFCKWEQRNELHKLEVSVNTGKQIHAEKVKIFTRSGIKLQEVPFLNGCARIVFAKQETEGNWNWEFSQIRVVLSDNQELVAEFPMEEKRQVNEPEFSKISEHVKEVVEETVKEEIPEAEKKVSGEISGPEKKESKEIEKPERKEEEIPKPEKRVAEETDTKVSLWEWLERTHEKIRPFGTNEEYFRIAVEDIYRLQEECHILRNNQFLLHGYYNYKYLILGKKEMDSEEYWLGVPGIYHEREKMAARMYGFEKFEGAKKRYGVGDLGYYLITAK